MDNALPHMLSHEALESAVKSITEQVRSGGIFVASIRVYDAILFSDTLTIAVIQPAKNNTAEITSGASFFISSRFF